MKHYRFIDRETGEEIEVESQTISEAFLAALEMVIDGQAVRPFFVGEVLA